MSPIPPVAMAVGKARQHASNGNWPMAAVESLPARLFARIYRSRTGYRLQRHGRIWRLDGPDREWWLPRPQDALRITHIGDDPRNRVVKKYLGSAPWDETRIQTVVDVGAFIGEFTILGGFDGIAIEPHPRNHLCCLLNMDPPAHVERVAAWYRDGGLAIHHATDTTEAAVGTPDATDEHRRIEVAGETVETVVGRSQYAPDEIDLVKVDAEGSEPEVLAGAVGLETRFAVDVGPERGGETTASATRALLESHGYETAVGGDVLFAQPQGIDHD